MFIGAYLIRTTDYNFNIYSRKANSTISIRHFYETGRKLIVLTVHAHRFSQKLDQYTFELLRIIITAYTSVCVYIHTHARDVKRIQYTPLRRFIGNNLIILRTDK